MDEIAQTLAPVEAEVRKRLGNFILAEDDQTLEGVVLAELEKRHATLTIVETFTSGQISARIGHLPGAEKVVRRGGHGARPGRGVRRGRARRRAHGERHLRRGRRSGGARRAAPHGRHATRWSS